MQIVEILFWSSLAAVLYAQLGYPLLMVPLARRKWVPRRSDADLPGVSLIIPAHNEEIVLRAKLENSLLLDYPREKLEIIVASDGSRDQTVAIAREFVSRGVQLLAFETNRGKSATISDAVAACSREVVCLCDANVMFRPDALRAMVDHLADPKVGAVSGDVRLASHESDFGTGESLYYRLERSLQLGESRVGSMMGVDGGMYVIRKELFRPLSPDTILDDFATSMHVIRRGKRIVYEPAAIATENGTPTWRHEFRRRVRVQTGAMQCLCRGQFPPLTRPVELWQFVSHKFLRWMGPLLLIAILATSILLTMQRAGYWAAAGVLTAVLATIAVVTLSKTVRRSRMGGIAMYYVLSHLAMFLGMVRYVLYPQNGKWSPTARVTSSTSELLRDSRSSSPSVVVRQECVGER